MVSIQRRCLKLFRYIESGLLKKEGKVQIGASGARLGGTVKSRVLGVQNVQSGIDEPFFVVDFRRPALERWFSLRNKKKKCVAPQVVQQTQFQIPLRDLRHSLQKTERPEISE